MKLNNESDDEYTDDPIKLFESEEERVHFGSRPQGNSTIYNFCESGENIESDNNLSGTSYSDLEYSQKRYCLPSYIKLVDCAKFPWYYKRYTQQIIEKTTNIDDSASESDINVEHITDDSNDCIIIEEEAYQFYNSNSKDGGSFPWPFVMSQTSAEKRKEKMTRNEDYELQRALRQKCTKHVDFKRNKGLIGMTITQKFVKDMSFKSTTPRVNKTKMSKDKKYTSGKDQIRSTESYGLGKNFPIKFSLGKMSETLVQRIKQQRGKQKLGTNLAKPPKLSNLANEVIRSGCHVNNIEMTNKFKNSQAKSVESKLKQLLTSEPNKKDTLDNPKKVDEVVTLDQGPPKSIDSKSAPSSPILPCILAKKNKNINDNIKTLENTLKKDMPKVQKLIDKPDTVNQVVNESVKGNIDSKDMANSLKKGAFKFISNTSSSKAIPIKVTKKPLPKIKDSVQLIKPEAHQEKIIHCKIVPKSNDAISNTQTFSSNHTNIKATTQTYVSIGQKNFNDLSKHINVPCSTVPSCFTNDSNKLSLVPNSMCNNLVSQYINATATFSNNTTSSSSVSVVDSKCKSMIVGTNNGSIIRTEDNKTRLPVQTAPGYEKKHINSENNKDIPYNAYTSAIVLRATQPNNFLNKVRSINPGRYARGTQKMQPRFYHHTYRAKSYTSQHSRNQRLNPTSANCASASYKFSSPPENSFKSLHNSPPYYPANRVWPTPNIYHNWGPRVEYSSEMFPFHLPLSVSQTPTAAVSSMLGSVSQPMNIGQIKFGAQPDSHFQIPNTHDRPNKNILDPRLVTQGIKEVAVNNVASETNSDLVTCKTKMLEILDSATNECTERCINEDDNTTGEKLVDTYKISKKSKSLVAVHDNFYSTQVDQSKGYSPPILPIPTFSKALDQVKTDTQQQETKQNVNISQLNVCNEIKSMNEFSSKIVSTKTQESAGNGRNKSKEKKYVTDYNIRAISEKSQKSVRKENSKKISFEEYKSRKPMAHQSKDSNKSKHKDTIDFNRKRCVVQINASGTGYRFSTESDLGYDSDSTVILQ